MAIGYVIPDGSAQGLSALATSLAAEANILDAAADGRTLFSRVKVLAAAEADITNAIAAVGNCKLQPGTTFSASPLASAEALWLAHKYSGSGDWVDLTGNGHDATPQATIEWDGIKFSLDGSSGQWFDVADAANLDFAAGTEMTVIAVVTPQVHDANLTVVSKITGGGFGSEVGWFLLFGTAGSGVAAFRLQDGTNTTESNFAYSEAGNRIALVGRRTADPNVELELEDLSDPSGDLSDSNADTTGILSNAQSLGIGALPGTGGTNRFTGDIYAIGLWRSDLSAADTATAIEQLQNL